MSKLVTLRKLGNRLILTAPVGLKDMVGHQYMVGQRSDGSIIYQPVVEENIFDNPDWRNYDYQRDLQADSELQSLYPVGTEWLGE